MTYERMATREWGVIHTKTSVFLIHGKYDECKKKYDEMEKEVMLVEILDEK